MEHRERAEPEGFGAQTERAARPGGGGGDLRGKASFEQRLVGGVGHWVSGSVAAEGSARAQGRAGAENPTVQLPNFPVLRG